MHGGTIVRVNWMAIQIRLNQRFFSFWIQRRHLCFYCRCGCTLRTSSSVSLSPWFYISWWRHLCPDSQRCYWEDNLKHQRNLLLRRKNIVLYFPFENSRLMEGKKQTLFDIDLRNTDLKQITILWGTEFETKRRFLEKKDNFVLCFCQQWGAWTSMRQKKPHKKGLKSAGKCRIWSKTFLSNFLKYFLQWRARKCPTIPAPEAIIWITTRTNLSTTYPRSKYRTDHDWLEILQILL